tara:strand:- start:2468 stop:3400 length:933 start_codon:yes stop_codon:yes gene_type:complete
MATPQRAQSVKAGSGGPATEQRVQSAKPAAGGISLVEPLLVLLTLLGVQYGLLPEFSDTIISTPAQMPLYEQTRELMDPAVLESLRVEALSHADQTVLSGAFSETQGIVLRFNRDGLRNLSASRWSGLMPFFEAAAEREMNAFVLNVLIVPDGRSVKTHLDNTVAIKSPNNHIAHCVTVLYLQIPLGMRGGQLELFENSRKESWSNPLSGDPDATLTPQVNTLVKFRGDAWHRISMMRSADGRPRISLVLEQYSIPEEVYAQTTRFSEKKLEAENHDVFQYIIQQLKQTIGYLVVAALCWFLWVAAKAFK